VSDDLNSSSRQPSKEVEVAGPNPAQGFSLFNNNNQPELPRQLNEQSNQQIDWSDFKGYLLRTCRPNTVKARMCYAKHYASVLTSTDTMSANLLLQLPPQKRLNVMKSLTALSRYLGCYENWQQIRKQHNLKWSTGDESLRALERFFNPEMSLDHIVDRVKQMMRVLPPVMSNIVKYAVLTGLRPSEAIESVKLLNSLPVNDCSSNTCINYYDPDQQTLRHYLFPDTFLRATKKAYLSYITPENLQPIANLGYKTPTWNAIRLACKHKKIDMEMRLCRKIFASHLRNSGIQPEVVDMLQGRVPPSVLTRHYLVPNQHFKTDLLKALKQLEQRLP
jgi:hypothetical protein